MKMKGEVCERNHRDNREPGEDGVEAVLSKLEVAMWCYRGIVMKL
jgi:hypothetical protein